MEHDPRARTSSSTRVSGYNTILFPTYLNGDAAVADRQRDRHHHGQLHGNTVRHRPRLQVNATAQYYIDHALGGRHEFKFGFDSDPRRRPAVEMTRFDDVTTNWNSQTDSAQNVTLYATPFNTATTLNVTALFVQDSYSMKRLTVTAGVR